MGQVNFRGSLPRLARSVLKSMLHPGNIGIFPTLASKHRVSGSASGASKLKGQHATLGKWCFEIYVAPWNYWNIPYFSL